MLLIIVLWKKQVSPPKVSYFMLSILQYRSNNIIRFAFTMAALLHLLFLTTFVFTKMNNFIFLQLYKFQ